MFLRRLIKFGHDGLLFKLEKCMPSQLFLIIKSFLENRILFYFILFLLNAQDKPFEHFHL